MSTAYHVGKDGECERIRSEMPMTHTPEPWTVQKNGKRLDIRQHQYGVIAYISKGFVANPRLNLDEDAARIVACVNGCAGLNPSAYRACVEALRQADNLLDGYGCSKAVRCLITDALAQAEGKG